MSAFPARKEFTPRLAESHPIYELRITGINLSDMEIAVWQLPSPSTPRLQSAERTAALSGRPWRLVESRIIKKLRQAGIHLSHMRKGQVAAYPVDESLALNLSLLFRVLAPMRSIDRIRIVADGIDKMSREEAGYWMGMALHRQFPRRVHAALRVLLTTP